ncbi:MAG TPA: low affinity iron permease family protein [Tepidisphaeraceae bacterium]|jgi:low affinity Fe/Cu permease
MSQHFARSAQAANGASNGNRTTNHRFNEAFRRMASASANLVGSKWAFILAIAIVVCWAITGPIFHYSDTWQLVINTGTTIVTFLMVFLIQNTQNRDAKAIHLKLDELIRGVKGARNHLVNLEEFSDEELADLQKQFEAVRAHAAERTHRTAEEANRKADVAVGMSERAHHTAGAAHDTADEAKRAADEARERVRRAEEAING